MLSYAITFKKSEKPPERELDKVLSYKIDYERRCKDE